GDGWQWMMEELTRFYESVANCPAPAHLGEAASFLSEAAVAPEVREHSALSLDAAALLGRRTAELHLALATPTDDPAFRPEPLTPQDIDRLREELIAHASSSFDALKE